MVFLEGKNKEPYASSLRILLLESSGSFNPEDPSNLVDLPWVRVIGILVRDVLGGVFFTWFSLKSR